MPAHSEKQRRAAGADLARMREGKKPRPFMDITEENLRHMAMSVKSKNKTSKKKR